LVKKRELFNRIFELRVDRPQYPDYPYRFAVDGGISIHPHPPLVIARPLFWGRAFFLDGGHQLTNRSADQTSGFGLR
jgi:hypothetical protein